MMGNTITFWKLAKIILSVLMLSRGTGQALKHNYDQSDNFCVRMIQCFMFAFCLSFIGMAITFFDLNGEVEVFPEFYEETMERRAEANYIFWSLFCLITAFVGGNVLKYLKESGYLNQGNGNEEEEVEARRDEDQAAVENDDDY